MLTDHNARPPQPTHNPTLWHERLSNVGGWCEGTVQPFLACFSTIPSRF
jgi:hypothetical protein